MIAALAAAAVLHAERLPIRVFTVSDGLAGESVRALLEDSHGYLWVGTSSGLSRFGGQRFRNYDTRDGLPGPRIDALAETPDGAIWVGTGQGLSRLPADATRGVDGTVFRSVPVPDTGLAGIGYLSVDRQGRLWIGTSSRLLVIDPLPSGSVDLRPPRQVVLPPGWSNALVGQAPNGDMWFGAHGLVHERGGRLSEVFPITAEGGPAGIVQSMLFDERGRLWFSTHEGVLLVTWPGFDGPLDGRPLRDVARPPRFAGELPMAPGEIIVYDQHHGLLTPYQIALVAGTGGPWVASQKGALHFTSGSLRAVTPAQGLPEAYVQVAIEDRSGTVWLGTESRGLARLRPGGPVTYDRADGLASERISSIAESDAGLLVTTASRDLALWNGRRFIDLTPHRLFLPGVEPGWGWGQYLLRDRRGRVWYPTARGLFRFSPARLQELPDTAPDFWIKPNGIPGDDMFRIYEDRRRDVWVSVLGSEWSLLRFVGGEHMEIEREIHGVNHGGAPTAFAEDRAGGLWIGFYLGSLGRRDDQGWRFFGTEDGLPPGFVNDLHVDRRGRLWVATISGGVARIDDPESPHPVVHRYRVQEGLTTDSTRCLAEGEDGAMYIGHSRGLDRLEVDSGKVRSYSVDDGLPNNLVWTCFAAADGTLWFGTMHGLAQLDPRTEAPRRAPALSISAVRVAGTPLELPELGTRSISGLELEPSQRALEIEFEALGLGQDAQILEQHRLSRGDEPWSQPAATRTLSFPDLSPGRYHLEIRTVSRDGHAGEPARMSFRLLPPLTARPWFRAAAAALLGAAVWGAFRMRVARLLAVERARTRIASDLHDDVGSGLSRIGMLGEIARRRLREAPDEAASVLEQIGRETATLAENASEIIWSVDPAKDDFESVVVRLRRFAADLFEARDIQLRFSAPPNADQIELLPEVRRAVYLVLKESINNVAKHSGASAVEIAIELHDGRIRAEVRDDGHGIDPDRAREAAEEGHRGLPGMGRRAAAVGGEVTIDSRPGGGTRIALSVPLRRRRSASHDHARRAPGGGDTTLPS